MDIVLFPDDPLTQVAEPFDTVDESVRQLAAEMFETMEMYDGCGLAGPQVGIAKQILVLHDPESGERMCLINPEISGAEGQALGEEGCLSLPQVFAQVPRATRLDVKALDENGQELEFEARDFLARIIQHETDHLKGIVFIDRLDILSREDKLQEWEEVRAQLAAAAAGQA